nr:hypothetical protein [Sphaerochaeta halotolerans]
MQLFEPSLFPITGKEPQTLVQSSRIDGTPYNNSLQPSEVTSWIFCKILYRDFPLQCIAE